ncbi:MAG: hypothetical protein U0871_04070 [Gemmataceae bacterium]
MRELYEAIVERHPKYNETVGYRYLGDTDVTELAYLRDGYYAYGKTLYSVKSGMVREIGRCNPPTDDED